MTASLPAPTALPLLDTTPALSLLSSPPPPPSQARIRSKTHYCYSDGELAELRERNPSAKLSVQRFKGLGEMMPAELWSTTMDPSTRMLKQVTAEDAAEADRLLSMLMGNNIGPRKAFIAEQAETLDWDLLDL